MYVIRDDCRWRVYAPVDFLGNILDIEFFW